MRRLPLGIDLGAARIRVVALSRESDGALRLAGAGAADVGDDRAAALRSALEQAKTRERRCIAMIRACDARLRTITLPPMSRRETNRAIRFEALTDFRTEGERVAVRSLVLGSSSGGERTMLLAATASHTVAETMSLLSSAGLRPACVDHEGCVLARVAETPLLDVGFTQSTLVASIEGTPAVHVFPIGGRDFTKALARDYGTTEEVAEGRKRTIGLGGAAQDVLESFLRALAAELRSLRDYGLNVTAIRLCGNGARLSELRDAIENELSVRALPVELAVGLVEDLPLEAQQCAAVDWFGAIAAALPTVA